MSLAVYLTSVQCLFIYREPSAQYELQFELKCSYCTIDREL